MPLVGTTSYMLQPGIEHWVAAVRDKRVSTIGRNMHVYIVTDNINNNR